MPGRAVCVTFENELFAANFRVSPVATDNVVCSVKGCGPRLENVLIFCYPLEADSVPLKEELFKYGDVHDIPIHLHLAHSTLMIIYVMLVTGVCLSRHICEGSHKA